MLFVERAADGDEMHDRKNALASVQLALEHIIVWQQPCHVRMSAEGRRLARTHKGVDLARSEQFA